MGENNLEKTNFKTSFSGIGLILIMSYHIGLIEKLKCHILCKTIRY